MRRKNSRKGERRENKTVSPSIQHKDGNLVTLHQKIVASTSTLWIRKF